MAIIDLAFRITGTVVPADQGCALYAALSGAIPDAHEQESVAILPINGRLAGNRKVSLHRQSRLTLRIPSDFIGLFLRLSGKQLDLHGHRVMVGVPEVRCLRASSTLRSRLVVIKGFMEPEAFLDAVRRQLHETAVSGQCELVLRRSTTSSDSGIPRRQDQSPYVRRTLRIHGREIVGYAVSVHSLSDEDSIRLQEQGIGGRRRFGCGIFVATGD